MARGSTKVDADEVEAAARAIYEDRNGPGCVPWYRREEAHRRPYRSDARAAIAALDAQREGRQLTRNPP